MSNLGKEKKMCLLLAASQTAVSTGVRCVMMRNWKGASVCVCIYAEGCLCEEKLELNKILEMSSLTWLVDTFSSSSGTFLEGRVTTWRLHGSEEKMVMANSGNSRRPQQTVLNE